MYEELLERMGEMARTYYSYPHSRSRTGLWPSRMAHRLDGGGEDSASVEQTSGQWAWVLAIGVCITDHTAGRHPSATAIEFNLREKQRKAEGRGPGSCQVQRVD